MSGLVLVTPPAQEPVTLDDLKGHLYIFDNAHDEQVTNYGIAARWTMEAERYPGLGIALITQTWDLVLDRFPSGMDPIELPKPPLQSVVSVSYTDSGGSQTTLVGGVDYITDNAPTLGPGCSPGFVVPVNGWPGASLLASNGVKVRIQAGFGDTETDIPPPLRIALMMLAGTFYEQREATAETKTTAVPFGYDNLTGLYRQPGVA